jgi:hypothetical protein
MTVLEGCKVYLTGRLSNLAHHQKDAIIPISIGTDPFFVVPPNRRIRKHENTKRTQIPTCLPFSDIYKAHFIFVPLPQPVIPLPAFPPGLFAGAHRPEVWAAEVRRATEPLAELIKYPSMSTLRILIENPGTTAVDHTFLPPPQRPTHLVIKTSECEKLAFSCNFPVL